MNDDRIRLADLGVVCALDDRGRPVTALPDDSPDVEAIERFIDFLRVAGPPGRQPDGSRGRPFSLDRWEALDALDPRLGAALAHHADRWTAQQSIGWHGEDVGA